MGNDITSVSLSTLVLWPEKLQRLPLAIRTLKTPPAAFLHLVHNQDMGAAGGGWVGIVHLILCYTSFLPVWGCTLQLPQGSLGWELLDEKGNLHF